MLVKTMNNSSSLNKKITNRVIDNINYDASGTVQDRLKVLENTIINMQNQIIDVQSQLYNIKKEVINEIYPVGSIYMSTEDDTIEKVQSKFGGTWEKYAQGRTIIGEGTGTDSNGLVQTFTNGSTGGEYTHKLTISEMPSHSHDIYANSYAGNLKIVMQNDNSRDGSSYGVQDSLHDADRTEWSLYAAKTGGSSSHNNIQPYTAIFMYKRVK